MRSSVYGLGERNRLGPQVPEWKLKDVGTQGSRLAKVPFLGTGEQIARVHNLWDDFPLRTLEE